MNILALNPGSSTLKYKLFRVAPDGAEEVLAKGGAELSGADAMVLAAGEAVQACRGFGIDAVGCRVVHGGPRFTGAIRITPEVVEDLRALEPLDPLHNPSEIALIDAVSMLLPGVPIAAAFDTSFHSTLPEVAWRYALPRDLCQELGLRRYGFHGLSHAYVSGRLREMSGPHENCEKVVVCHLGSGSSVCAIRSGESVDTSMGMTPLEGLMMGTRAGDVDPGLLLYLMQSGGWTAEQLDESLNRRSGLLGVSGRSSDVRKLESAATEGDAESDLALELFAYRVRKYIGAYAAVLGGLDAVVFTGGIGENSAGMRRRICRGLEFLNLRLDPRDEAPGGAPSRISSAGSLPVWVIPTDEERQIAREVAALRPDHPS